MIKKEMIAMLLAGGQGSRLGVLTAKVAKPAVAFGGKYRIIDFPLSNCINSGVDTVGVLTQYQPLRLNTHIGIGIPWDLDRNIGGVSVLPPYEKSTDTEWYTGTANAIYQNIEYMDSYNPDYVLILSGDHIYKMDYEVMLDYHKAKGAEVTLAAMPVPLEEAKRFGILITDDSLSTVEVFTKTFNSTADTIMEKSTTSNDIIKIICIVVGIIIVIGGIIYILRMKFKRDKEKAKETVEILKTPLDKSDELRDKYLNEEGKE